MSVSLSFSSILNKAISIRSKGFSPAVTTTLSVLAAVGLIWLSVRFTRSQDLQWRDLNKRAAVPCALLGFTQLPLNATEYRLSSKLAGSTMSWRPALQTTVVASAANILPIPAGAMIRVQGLRNSGAGTASSFAGTGAIATTWLAISALIAACVLVGRGSVGGSAGFIVLFVVAAVGATATLRQCPARSAPLILSVIGLETLYVVLAAIRFWLALQTLNVSASATDVLVIASGSPVASAAGIIPGALGIAEVLAGGAAKLVNLPGDAGFLAAVLLRVIGILVSATAFTWIGFERLRGWARPSRSDEVTLP